MRGTALLDHKEAETIVAAWREVEREIGAVEPGSPEYVTLYIEARQLREEYQRLVDRARTNLRPEPPPFPESR
jgi:hypothetical protein